jgi:hypothetical protein
VLARDAIKGGAAYIIEANLNPARCHMLAPDLEAWLKSDGTSNRSRVTNVATLSARDLFEAKHLRLDNLWNFYAGRVWLRGRALPQLVGRV